MKDPKLVELNFHELLHYGGQPKVFFEYPDPMRPKPTGYCLSCEEEHLLEKTGRRLDLMSHGCDSTDFETVLGPMPNDGPTMELPILFLLENPGGDYNNGEPLEFRGFKKQPPTKHYYWTPNSKGWPTCAADFKGNFYGPYFAYLMRKFQLRNVYITNLIKCKWVEDAKQSDTPGKNWNPQVIADHCTKRYLTRELKIFNPHICFCFGQRAEEGLRTLIRRTGTTYDVRYLLHPSAIKLAQRHGKSQSSQIQQNDEWVGHEIERLRRSG